MYFNGPEVIAYSLKVPRQYAVLDTAYVFFEYILHCTIYSITSDEKHLRVLKSVVHIVHVHNYNWT